MTANWLEGGALSKRLREEAAARGRKVAADLGRPPTLASLRVGDDAASEGYQRTKGGAATRIGLDYRAEHLPAGTPTGAVVDALRRLQADDGVDAVMVEMPLPAGCDTAAVVAAIDLARDVDAVHPASLGRLACGLPGPVPATPRAVMALLAESGVPLAGAHAVVVGRSRTVGLPAALLLLQADATVTVCHSRSRRLAAHTRRADVLVVAAGRPGLVGPADIKPGAVVVDVGTNWVSDGAREHMVGDVDTAAVAEVAGWVTPVPGGVGPVTTALILLSTVELAERRLAPSAG